MKNGPKINHKSIKNGPQIYQKSSKIEVWRAPGQVWSPLGPSRAIQRILESILDRLGGVMEASWAGKVANMAPTWPQVGSQNGGKIRLGPSRQRLGRLLEGSCNRLYAFLMQFCCMLKKYAFEADFFGILIKKMLHGTDKISQIILRK